MRIKDKTQSKIAGFYECSKKESYFREELTWKQKPGNTKHFLFLLVIIIIIQTCKASAEFLIKEIQEIEKYTINGGERGKLVVSRKGALHPLRAYLSTRLKHMENKRLLSGQINIARKLKITKLAEEDIQIIFIESKEEDRVHTVLHGEKEVVKYIREFFNTFISMFPSHNNKLSIESSNQQSFYAFLQNHRDTGIDYRLLACLLLISEGVNVPLAVKNSMDRADIVLCKANNTEELFRIDIGPFSNDNTVKNIIQFFIRNRTNPVLQKEKFVEPTTLEDYRTGRFMNSPKFLIEGYINMYIDTVPNAHSFIQTVHDLLQECMSSKKKKSPNSLYRVAESVFDRYFDSFPELPAQETEEGAGTSTGAGACIEKEETCPSKNTVPCEEEVIMGLLEYSELVHMEKQKGNLYFDAEVYTKYLNNGIPYQKSELYWHCLYNTYLSLLFNRDIGIGGRIDYFVEAITQEESDVNSGINSFFLDTFIQDRSSNMAQLFIQLAYWIEKNNLDKNNYIVRFLENGLRTINFDEKEVGMVISYIYGFLKIKNIMFPHIILEDAETRLRKFYVGEVSLIYNRTEYYKNPAQYLAKTIKREILTNEVIPKYKIGMLSDVLINSGTDVGMKIVGCLTNNGANMRYLVLIMNSILNAEKAGTYRVRNDHVNTLLLAVIGVASVEKDRFASIITQCFEIMAVEDQKICLDAWGDSVVALENIIAALKTVLKVNEKEKKTCPKKLHALIHSTRNKQAEIILKVKKERIKMNVLQELRKETCELEESRLTKMASLSSMMLRPLSMIGSMRTLQCLNEDTKDLLLTASHILNIACKLGRRIEMVISAALEKYSKSIYDKVTDVIVPDLDEMDSISSINAITNNILKKLHELTEIDKMLMGMKQMEGYRIKLCKIVNGVEASMGLLGKKILHDYSPEYGREMSLILISMLKAIGHINIATNESIYNEIAAEDEENAEPEKENPAVNGSEGQNQLG